MALKGGFLFIGLRIILALVAVASLMQGNKELSLFIFSITGAISFLDGLIAKRKNAPSQLRSVFDPFADKLLINGVTGALYVSGLFPYWAFVAYLSKDLFFIIAGAFKLLQNPKTIFRSNAIDKFSTFIQMLTLFFILAGRLDIILLWISLIFAAISFVATLFRSGVRIVRYKSEFEEIRFRKLIKLPALFTILNILMGLGGILLVIYGNHLLAGIALMLAVFFDFLDGKVARWKNAESDFGKQLDSLADTISFGIAPALFGFSLINTPFAVIIFAIFVLAGVLRLARYNIMEFSGEFAGMPITVNGIIVPLVYFIGVPAKLFPYLFLLLALAMVSPVRIKKIF